MSMKQGEGKALLQEAWNKAQNRIKGYHIHIYENGRVYHGTARLMAETMQKVFPDDIGKIYDVGIVGPHSKENVEIDIKPQSFGKIVKWMQMNNFDLSILIHPDTGDDLHDHLNAAMWIGEPVPFQESFFQKLKQQRRANKIKP